MMEWIMENKEWIFSGVGVVVIGAVGRFLYKKRSESGQVQKSGKNSVNIQVGKDFNIGKGYNNDK